MIRIVDERKGSADSYAVPEAATFMVFPLPGAAGGADLMRGTKTIMAAMTANSVTASQAAGNSGVVCVLLLDVEEVDAKTMTFPDIQA